MRPFEPELRRAAEAIARADALVIAAGAGMGVDSGLPDFRGNQGFWNAYPPYAKLGLDFVSLASPQWFRDDPALAWGFYGHRRNLYRATAPHPGFSILKRWGEHVKHGAFVFTSNVDGHFQRSGFDPDRVFEVHGAVDWMQCTKFCGVGIYPAEESAVDLDESTMRAREPFPACPRCGSLARPNIMMFGDWDFDTKRTYAQHALFEAWLATVSLADARLVVLEFGAGRAIPTIRRGCEDLVKQRRATLIRVNPREPEVPPGQIGLPMGAREAIEAVQWPRKDMAL